jgi:hypothetical protein
MMMKLARLLTGSSLIGMGVACIILAFTDEENAWDESTKPEANV